MNAVQTKHLNKSYRQGAIETTALLDVNLVVEDGDFVSVTGASGSGKSTLLHMLGGVDRPSSGDILLDGINIGALSDPERAVLRRRKIGFIFQFYNLLPVLSAEENITLPLLLDGHKPDDEYLEELLSLLNLRDRRSYLPSQLSGGQQQRVAIARALITRPTIILADEPTGNLDSVNGREVIDLLTRGVRMLRQTLLLVTHDRELACEADRMLTIEDGVVKRDQRMRV